MFCFIASPSFRHRIISRRLLPITLQASIKLAIGDRNRLVNHTVCFFLLLRLREHALKRNNQGASSTPWLRLTAADRGNQTSAFIIQFLVSRKAFGEETVVVSQLVFALAFFAKYGDDGDNPSCFFHFGFLSSGELEGLSCLLSLTAAVRINEFCFSCS